MFYRLIKPSWGKTKLFKNGESVDNPNFVKAINGPDILEGCFEESYLKEKNAEGYNVYWFPNHPSKNIYSENIKFLSGKHIDTFKYVFVDMDLKDGIYKDKLEFLEKLDEFPVKPTIVVNSGNGVHAYWEVEDLTKEAYIILQFGLINYLKTDESVWTVLQLMRVPEFLNTKDPENPKPAEIIKELSSGEVYKTEDLIGHLNITADQEKKAQNHLDKLEGKAIVGM